MNHNYDSRKLRWRPLSELTAALEAPPPPPPAVREATSKPRGMSLGDLRAAARERKAESQRAIENARTSYRVAKNQVRHRMPSRGR